MRIVYNLKRNDKKITFSYQNNIGFGMILKSVEAGSVSKTRVSHATKPRVDIYVTHGDDACVDHSDES